MTPVSEGNANILWFSFGLTRVSGLKSAGWPLKTQHFLFPGVSHYETWYRLCGKGNSRKQGQQAQGVTGKGGGQHDGGVGRNHVIGKGRRKGGYESATGPAAGARVSTVGAAATDDGCRGKADAVMKCEQMATWR